MDPEKRGSKKPKRRKSSRAKKEPNSVLTPAPKISKDEYLDVTPAASPDGFTVAAQWRAPPTEIAPCAPNAPIYGLTPNSHKDRQGRETNIFPPFGSAWRSAASVYSFLDKERGPVEKRRWRAALQSGLLAARLPLWLRNRFIFAIGRILSHTLANPAGAPPLDFPPGDKAPCAQRQYSTPYEQHHK